MKKLGTDETASEWEAIYEIRRSLLNRQIMKKIKNIYLEDNNRIPFLVLELEDGTLYRDVHQPTGSCWALYWSKPEVSEVEELAQLIQHVQKQKRKAQRKVEPSFWEGDHS